MIELTDQQIQAVASAGERPTVVVDPKTMIPYVLLRKDVYECLTGEEYDDSPWTDEERDLLVAEVDAMLDDDMGVEDAAP